MSTENGEIYIMSGDGDEWVTPTPARTAIVDAVIEATDLDAGDIDDIESYVDLTDLRNVLDRREQLTFSVEGHDVVVDETGNIDVPN